MSLARLLAKQRGRDEARAMLVEIYSWFTEGFDAADLKDAKALLEDQISQSVERRRPSERFATRRRMSLWHYK
jgi:hypothetical protein